MKIPPKLLSKLLGLYFHFCARNLTVSVWLIEKDGQTRILVPRQVAASAWTQAEENDSCDLVTGQRENSYPPTGWNHYGGVYCHNTMGPFFSGTTDKNELRRDGYYFCVGDINLKEETYRLASSKVINGRRFVTGNEIDLDVKPDFTYDQTVNNFISKRVYATDDDLTSCEEPTSHAKVDTFTWPD